MNGYAQEKDAYLKRMRRIEGQVRGIARMSESTYTVTGMTCGHCVASVTEEINRIDGVAHVTVDLPTGAVTVTTDRPIDDAQLRAAVREAGYQLAD